MKNKTEESLLDALQYCSLRKLPEVEDGENVWIRAIAKVAKADGQMYYAYVEKDDKLQNKIIKDFGPISALVRVVEYYPFSYLKPAFMPKFKGNKKEERIAYLTRYNKDLDYSNYSVKELDKLIMLGAIKKQMEQEEREKENNG